MLNFYTVQIPQEIDPVENDAIGVIDAT